MVMLSEKNNHCQWNKLIQISYIGKSLYVTDGESPTTIDPLVIRRLSFNPQMDPPFYAQVKIWA